MPTTYPNQRTVKIHREDIKTDFLGIKNENWMAAARDLRAHAFLLYLYFASNANNFTLALSQVAVQEAIGMPRSTYHDQFRILLNKGYLVETSSNHYDFFEKPKPRDGAQENEYRTATVQNSEKCTSDGKAFPIIGQDVPQNSREINNINNDTNTKEKYIPNVREFVIPIPTAETKERIRQRELHEGTKRTEFVF